MRWGIDWEGEAMQREATRSEVPRRRVRRGGVLCALCLTPWLMPAAILAADGPDVAKYDQKGSDDRDASADLDPYAGWFSDGEAELDVLGSSVRDDFEITELDPDAWIPDALAATGTGDTNACVITLTTTVPATGAVGAEVQMSVRPTTTASAPAVAVVARYDVDYGDGTEESFLARTGAPLASPFPIKHKYTLEGWYSVTVNAIGSVQGVTTATCRAGTFYGLHTPLQVKPQAAPSGDALGTYHPSIQLDPAGSFHVGDDVTFTALTGMPASEEARYYLDFRWSLGDGTEARGRTVTRTFMQPVSQTASLDIFAYTGSEWKQVGTNVTKPYVVDRGLEVVGYVPEYMGRIRDLALSEFDDANRTHQQIVWSVSSTRVAMVNVNNPRAPKVLGGLRAMQIPWIGSTATSVNGAFTVAATDKIVAISIASYGIFLFDAQTAPFSSGPLVPFARVDTWAAVDLAFDRTGSILFAVTPVAIRAYDVSKWVAGPRVLSTAWVAPLLAHYDEPATFTGLHVDGNLLYVGQARPMALDVFEFGDLDSVAGKDIVRRSQFASNGTMLGGAMAPPRDFAIVGSVLAVNENWLVYGSPGYTAFYDIRNPRQPTLRSRQGQAQAGVAMLTKADGTFAYSTDMAYAVEIDTTVAGDESVVELTELALGAQPLGRGSKVLADPRGNRLYVGATGSALVVLEVK